ncbi:glycoside hydrolase [Enterococcus durans IPLA 655]|uniref:glycosyltransferase family 4 protein n=1 Tax=Enterococcus durans TaxID=53345 RepID=UPI00032859AC|nr:glycosyltransferase family 4 protein [Enterococcus durans]EMS76499.1 glycoside hydrolase [Enterococcus durans IPLA 655]KST50356.1 1,2-diacylglycerol 3-glucosyltransferase [Enterococcus durans]MDU1848984.1 glycosyltransferase family 4 protein [Enterococcus durans]
MKIGFFTDTYFPQVSGVATSIKTLKEELEKNGHEVYIFTTTDPNADKLEKDVIRMPSVPFVSFKDRRVVVRGMWYAYLVAKELELELIHTHTEFGAGILGKMVAKKLKIPLIHTYHTMYEDYLHYIAKGKVLRQSHVKYLSRLFANHTTGVVCPSERVIDTLRGYGVVTPLRVIPTGIDIEKFKRADITNKDIEKLRQSLHIEKDQLMILSLSRISYEKNIQALVYGLPQIIKAYPNARMVIVGKGPYLEELQELIVTLDLSEYVQFTGEVANDDVALYYKAADFFVSASTSETQGLTYTEAMAAGTPCVVEGNAYLNRLFDHPSLGRTFEMDQDFAPALIDYIKSEVPHDPQVLESKLYEISSTHFGEAMIEFYEDMIVYHANELQRKEEEASIERIKIKLNSFKR